jgi:HNH endonuclease
MTPQSPQGYIIATECNKAAFDNGWRVEQGEVDGWLIRTSATAPGRVALTGEGGNGPWALAVEHGAVVNTLEWPRSDLAGPLSGPGTARYVFATLSELHAALSRVYDLSMALPDDPLRRFELETRKLPKTTEAERLVIERRGQSIFRDSLMKYWQGRCPLTGIAEPELLRASHMKPWAKCESDAERLDVFNGLLLSALWDAAFDRGLVSFSPDGEPIYSSRLSEVARSSLLARPVEPLVLTAQHQVYLEHHRNKVFTSG